MRSYVIASGLLFAAIALAHAARVVAEGSRVLGDPLFLVASLIALGMAGWAGITLRGLKRRQQAADHGR